MEGGLPKRLETSISAVFGDWVAGVGRKRKKETAQSPRKREVNSHLAR